MKPQDEYFDLSFLKPDVGCAELTEKLKDYDKLQCYIWGCKLSQGREENESLLKHCFPTNEVGDFSRFSS